MKEEKKSTWEQSAGIVRLDAGGHEHYCP